MQFYDYTELAGEAARQFTEFLSNKFPNANSAIAIDEETRAEVNRRANSIASFALGEDENLLAFAIAAPSIHTVVVKFKDNVTVSSSAKLGQPTTLQGYNLLLFSPPFSRYHRIRCITRRIWAPIGENWGKLRERERKTDGVD